MLTLSHPVKEVAVCRSGFSLASDCVSSDKGNLSLDITGGSSTLARGSSDTAGPVCTGNTSGQSTHVCIHSTHIVFTYHIWSLLDSTTTHGSHFVGH